MKKQFEDSNGNEIEIDSDNKTLCLNQKQPKFEFRNPNDMMQFAASINIIANRWIANIPDELYDSFRLEKKNEGIN